MSRFSYCMDLRTQGHWQALGDLLTPSYRIIAPDLPLHGRSRSFGPEYGPPDTMARAVYQLTAELGLDRFHRRRNSFGGGVAGVLAALYPENVASLAFRAPRRCAHQFRASLTRPGRRQEPHRAENHGGVRAQDFAALLRSTEHLTRASSKKWELTRSLAGRRTRNCGKRAFGDFDSSRPTSTASLRRRCAFGVRRIA